MGDLRQGERWSTAQRLRNDGIYAIAMVALGGARQLSIEARTTLGGTLGRTLSVALPGARKRAAQRLRRAFGATPPVTPQQVFETVGRDLADTVALLDPAEPVDRTLRLGEGVEGLLGEAVQEGRGVVFATAHLGPIERMAALVASKGYPVATLARESYDPRFTDLYDRLRSPRGVKSIYRGRPGTEFAIARALKTGHLVGFPMDLAGRGMATMRCDFLGEPTEIPLGPARLALRTGAPVLVGTPASASSGLQVIVERIEVAKADEQGLTESLAQALEERIRALPSHWVWMHRAQAGVVWPEEGE